LSETDGRDTLWKFYQRYRQELYAYALSITRRQSLAEDAVQNTFVSLSGQSKAVRNVRAYVLRTLRNTALDQLKTAKRNLSFEETRPDCFLAAPRGDQPDHRCLEKEACEQVDQALNQIPFEQKETIVLKIFAGLKFREIAELLDEPMATIASRYRRGLEALTGPLQEYFDEHERC